MRGGVWKPCGKYAGSPRIILKAIGKMKTSKEEHFKFVTDVKMKLRKKFNENIVHSTDCTQEARYFSMYIKKICNHA